MDSIDVKKIADSLNNLSGNITLGIDGFIDDVWEVVESRSENNELTIYTKMKKLGEAIVRCGEGGFSHEIIHKRRSYGGFTGNTGNALACLDVKPTMIGMYGQDSYDPVFERFIDMGCSLVTVGESAICVIYEFEDGKIMLPYIDKVMNFNWGALQKSKNFERIKQIYLNSDIIALGYWSLTPAFDEIIAKICDNFIEGGRCRRFFFDFADIRKRERKHLEDTLDKLAVLNKTVPMTLSLNEHEAELLFSYYGEQMNESNLEHTTTCIREKIGLNEIVVHTPHIAVAANAIEGSAAAIQNFCPNPVKTTGAGDTFNGGYLAASLGCMQIKERLAVGNAATVFYVRNGRAADKSELLKELGAIQTHRLRASVICHGGRATDT